MIVFLFASSPVCERGGSVSAENGNERLPSISCITSFIRHHCAGVPNGHITNNTLVWNKITFPAVTTGRIRVLINNADGGWSRIVDVEAYPPAGQTSALTPAQSGQLADMIASMQALIAELAALWIK